MNIFDSSPKLRAVGPRRLIAAWALFLCAGSPVATAAIGGYASTYTAIGIDDACDNCPRKSQLVFDWGAPGHDFGGAGSNFMSFGWNLRYLDWPDDTSNMPSLLYFRHYDRDWNLAEWAWIEGRGSIQLRSGWSGYRDTLWVHASAVTDYDLTPGAWIYGSSESLADLSDVLWAADPRAASVVLDFSFEQGPNEGAFSSSGLFLGGWVGAQKQHQLTVPVEFGGTATFSAQLSAWAACPQAGSVESCSASASASASLIGARVLTASGALAANQLLYSEFGSYSLPNIITGYPPDPEPTPEPGTWALTMGAFGAACVWRRRVAYISAWSARATCSWARCSRTCSIMSITANPT